MRMCSARSNGPLMSGGLFDELSDRRPVEHRTLGGAHAFPNEAQNRGRRSFRTGEITLRGVRTVRSRQGFRSA